MKEWYLLKEGYRFLKPMYLKMYDTTIKSSKQF